MKPNLLVCLGNPLMGDDAIAWRLHEQLRVHGGLPLDWDLHFAGTDLLSAAAQMDGRHCIVLADAMESALPTGTVEIVEADSFSGNPNSAGAHQMSAIDALRLIQLTSDGVRTARFVLFGVAVHSVRCEDSLSPRMEERFLEIVGALLALTRQLSRDDPPGT